MIGQYLSNTNESATIPILQNFLELNKAKQGATPSSLHRRYGVLCPRAPATINRGRPRFHGGAIVDGLPVGKTFLAACMHVEIYACGNDRCFRRLRTYNAPGGTVTVYCFVSFRF